MDLDIKFIEDGLTKCLEKDMDEFIRKLAIISQDKIGYLNFLSNPIPTFNQENAINYIKNQMAISDNFLGITGHNLSFNWDFNVQWAVKYRLIVYVDPKDTATFKTKKYVSEGKFNQEEIIEETIAVPINN